MEDAVNGHRHLDNAKVGGQMSSRPLGLLYEHAAQLAAKDWDILLAQRTDILRRPNTEIRCDVLPDRHIHLLLTHFGHLLD